MSNKAKKPIPGNRLGKKSKHKSENALNDDIPSFLYSGIPTSLLSSDLSSSLHNSLKVENSGSPYPIMDNSRNSLPTTKVKEKKIASPNLKVNTSVDEEVHTPFIITPSNHHPVTTKKSLENFEKGQQASPKSLHASTPNSNSAFSVRSVNLNSGNRNSQHFHLRNNSLTTPSKIKVVDQRSQSLNDTPRVLSDNSDTSVGNRSDTFQFHTAYESIADLRNSSIAESDDFSYDKTENRHLETFPAPNNFNDEFHFHSKSASASPISVQLKKSQDLNDVLDAPAPVSNRPSHTPSSSAGNSDNFVSPHITNHETSHSHNSSVNSQSSFHSLKLSRNRPVASPHSRQSSVSWAVNNPDEWNLDRVIYWLNLYGFNKSWVEVFTKNSLTGTKFLSLTNYNNISKYIEHLDISMDSTPSRFIHLLRKTLDKPNSDATLRLSSPSLEIPSSKKSLFADMGLFEEDDQSILSSSGVTSVTPSPIQSSEAVLMNSKASKLQAEDSQLSELVPTFSAPNLSTNDSKRSPMSKSSQDTFSCAYPRSLKKGSRAPTSRPFSTIEDSSHGFIQPASPASFSQGFFKRHSKSNSSESSIFNSLFTGTSGSSFTSELDGSGKKSLKLESPTTGESRKGLMSKLRNKVSERTKLQDQKSRPLMKKGTDPPLSSLSSPVDSNPMKKISEAKNTKYVETLDKLNVGESSGPSASSQADGKVVDQISMLKFVLDRKYQPKSDKTNSDLFILITNDNKTFRPCNVGSASNLADLKTKVLSELLFPTTDCMSFYLTDFGSVPGEQLTDEILDKLRSFAFYGGTSKLLVHDGSNKERSNSLLNDLSLSTSSTRSSMTQSIGEANTYPATPQYLLGVSNQKDPVDYLNFKDSYLQSRRKSSLVSGRPLQPLTSLSTDERGDISSVGSIAGSVSSSNKTHSKLVNETYANSFRVIRKESVGEIDFDKRRESPFQKSQIIAKRNPPPPPSVASQENLSRTSSSLSRNRSIKKKRTEPLPPVDTSYSRPLLLTAGSRDDDSSNYLSPFTPGLSTTLVPQPYRGSVSPARTPITPRQSSTFDDEKESRFVTLRGSQTTAGVPRVIDRPSMIRDQSFQSVRTILDKDKFKENFISFEGAPSLSDEDTETGDSDDDLWAKPPTKSTSSEALNTVESDSEVTGLDVAAKMTVRPPAEVVYDNLERFFPNADLDRPIVDDVSSPLMSPLVESSPILQKLPVLQVLKNSEKRTKSISRKVSNADDETPKAQEKGNTLGRHQRMKTIRVVAREANEARKRLSEDANKSKKPNLLRRTSTKMWGQKVVEVTPSQLKGGYVSKLKNHNGEYKQFAWVKGELIGKGTFGKVYLALNVTTGEMMAVKQVKMPRSGRANQQVTEVIDALLSEVETMKDLDHINIVQYLGFEKVGNIHSLFLEYVAGGSVGSCLRMYGRFEEDLIRYLTAQILRGLSYLHSRGILHRDLKADNLLLEIDGSCKISDFGISKRSQNIYANDAEMSMQGTIFWMAPEVIDNVVHNKKQGYSAKVDIWSLGCVVLEMFAGRRPWSNVEAIGAIYKLGKTKLAPPIPEDTLPFVSQEGRDFIEKCFTIDPEKRPTAQELLRHPFCKVDGKFEFKGTKLAQLIKFNEKSKEEVLRLEAKENRIKDGKF